MDVKSQDISATCTAMGDFTALLLRSLTTDSTRALATSSITPTSVVEDNRIIGY